MRHRRLRSLALAGLGVAAPLAGAACSEPAPTFDRGAAVQRVIDESGGALNRQQAECYVNRVVDEVGANQLEPDAKPSANQISRLTSIRIDCVGVANLGRSPATGTVRPVSPDETSARRLPQRKGDDAQLDLLYDACQQGSGAACDSLFDAAPPGSEYEEFAVTCGGRTREKKCADVYTSGPSLAPPAPAPTPAAPASAPR
jgi:hypothetical protein